MKTKTHRSYVSVLASEATCAVMVFFTVHECRRPRAVCILVGEAEDELVHYSTSVVGKTQ